MAWLWLFREWLGFLSLEKLSCLSLFLESDSKLSQSSSKGCIVGRLGDEETFSDILVDGGGLVKFEVSVSSGNSCMGGSLSFLWTFIVGGGGACGGIYGDFPDLLLSYMGLYLLSAIVAVFFQ